MSGAASNPATLVGAPDREGLRMAISTSHEPVSQYAVARRKPLANSACDRRRRTVRRATSIGRAIDHRAMVPGCWIVHPVFVSVGVMLILLVMTDIAIIVMAVA
jgi:hypothetical protein